MNTLFLLISLSFLDSSDIETRLEQAKKEILQEKEKIIIIKQDRTPNFTGNQCVWSSIETTGRYLKIPSLYNLTQRYHFQAGPGEVDYVLQRLGVNFHQNYPGRFNETFLLDAMKRKLPVTVGLLNRHAVTLIYYDDKEAHWIDNLNPNEVVKTRSDYFNHVWDGWGVVIYPQN